MTNTETNDYWEAVRDFLEPDSLAGGALVVDNYGSLAHRRDRTGYQERCDRMELTSRYSWTVTAPETVGFVVEHCGNLVVDPLAGSGWWAHLLGDAGVTVIASDQHQPGGSNTYHRHTTHVPVAELDAAAAVDLAPDGATLLLSWAPMDDTAYRAVKAFRGTRLIHIGEGWGGCTGDDDLFELLGREWAQVAEHRPIQFYGLHDYVTVYDRKGI